MTINSGEQSIFSNRFGEISDRRLIYLWKKHWFSGKRRVDIPIKQVVSVSHDTDRSIFYGLFLTVVGISLLRYFNFFGIIFFLTGIFMIWGSPRVTVRNAGAENMPSVGFPWEKKSAEEFAVAVRNQLFKD